MSDYFWSEQAVSHNNDLVTNNHCKLRQLIKLVSVYEFIVVDFESRLTGSNANGVLSAGKLILSLTGYDSGISYLKEGVEIKPSTEFQKNHEQIDIRHIDTDEILLFELNLEAAVDSTSVSKGIYRTELDFNLHHLKLKTAEYYTLDDFILWQSEGSFTI